MMDRIITKKKKRPVLFHRIEVDHKNLATPASVAARTGTIVNFAFKIFWCQFDHVGSVYQACTSLGESCGHCDEEEAQIGAPRTTS